MEKIMPLVIICAIGIAVCLSLLSVIAWKNIRGHFDKRHCHEVFEMDENTLTVKLDKKDFHK